LVVEYGEETLTLSAEKMTKFLGGGGGAAPPPPHPHHWGGLEGAPRGYPGPSRPPQQPSLAAYAAVNKWQDLRGAPDVVSGAAVLYLPFVFRFFRSQSEKNRVPSGRTDKTASSRANAGKASFESTTA